jgi:hypothetical protein
MKSKSILLLIGLMVCATILATAQSTDDSRIKILRTEKSGVIKVMHALDTDTPVLVRFTNDQGIVGEDKIDGDFPKGVLRRYDLTNIFDKSFRIEVKSQNVDVTYKITPSKDRKTFIAFLEKVEHHSQLVASR